MVPENLLKFFLKLHSYFLQTTEDSNSVGSFSKTQKFCENSKYLVTKDTGSAVMFFSCYF